MPWDPQITTPMPLEALYSLMEEQKAHGPLDRNVINGDNINQDALILVTKDFFKSGPNDIDKEKVSNDVLAFCTLVLSYAKMASTIPKKDESPKLFTAFMPRTEFNTLYEQVKSKIPGDLFNLFNILACYKNKAV